MMGTKMSAKFLELGAMQYQKWFFLHQQLLEEVLESHLINTAQNVEKG